MHSDPKNRSDTEAGLIVAWDRGAIGSPHTPSSRLRQEPLRPSVRDRIGFTGPRCGQNREETPTRYAAEEG